MSVAFTPPAAATSAASFSNYRELLARHASIRQHATLGDWDTNRDEKHALLSSEVAGGAGEEGGGVGGGSRSGGAGLTDAQRAREREEAREREAARLREEEGVVSSMEHWRVRCWGRDALLQEEGSSSSSSSSSVANKGGRVTLEELAKHLALPRALHVLAQLFANFAIAQTPSDRLQLALDFVAASRQPQAADGRDGAGGCLCLAEGAVLALNLLQVPLRHEETAVEAALTLLVPLARLLPSVHRHKLLVHLEAILGNQGARYAARAGGGAEGGVVDSAGAQFTCFTRTKAQILAQKQAQRGGGVVEFVAKGSRNTGCCLLAERVGSFFFCSRRRGGGRGRICGEGGARGRGCCLLAERVGPPYFHPHTAAAPALTSHEQAAQGCRGRCCRRGCGVCGGGVTL